MKKDKKLYFGALGMMIVKFCLTILVFCYITTETWLKLTPYSFGFVYTLLNLVFFDATSLIAVSVACVLLIIIFAVYCGSLPAFIAWPWLKPGWRRIIGIGCLVLCVADIVFRTALFVQNAGEGVIGYLISTLYDLSLLVIYFLLLKKYVNVIKSK